MWRSTASGAAGGETSEQGGSVPKSQPRGSATPSLRRKVSVKLAAFMRWLHIYLSMFGLATLLFFSITGITLNHPDWLNSGPETTSESQGRMRPEWLSKERPVSRPSDGTEGAGASDVDKLEVVEYLRAAHKLRGALTNFQIDDQECVVTFKGAGYSADAFIERETGEYRITETQHGLMTILNELHKGRETGKVWSWVIDISAVLLSIASLSGLILLFYIKRRRRLGTLVGIIGTLVLVVIAYYFVP